MKPWLLSQLYRRLPRSVREAVVYDFVTCLITEAEMEELSATAQVSAWIPDTRMYYANHRTYIVKAERLRKKR